MNITATRRRIVELTVVELVHLSVDVESEMFDVEVTPDSFNKLQTLLDEIYSEIEQRETDSELNLG